MTLLASNSYLDTWYFNEGQDLPFQRQGCRDQSQALRTARPSYYDFFSFLSH